MNKNSLITKNCNINILSNDSPSNNPTRLASITNEQIKNECYSPKFSNNVEQYDTLADVNVSPPAHKSSVLTFSNLNLVVESSRNGSPSNSSNKLLLTGELFFNREILIDKNGMINGLRNKKDGQIFFGLSNIKDYTGTYYNDFIINFRPTGKKKKSPSGRVFEISYHNKTSDFWLSMIDSSLIMNYEINNLFYFEDDRDYYLVLGKVFITIITRKNVHKKFIDIIIEIEEEDKEVKYTFSEDETPISIGRIKSDISINNPSVSKKHAMIEYSLECQMFYFRDLGSTNGSVAVIKEGDKIKIKGDMKFKLESVPFRIMELP